MQSKTRVNKVKICALLTGFLLICGVNILFAESFNPYLTYHCYKTESAIKIDGKLDEEAWKNTIPTPVFGDLVTGEAPRYSVKAKMLWDENYLYIAYEIEDPNVWAFKTIRDDPMGGQPMVGKISGIKNMPSLRAGWGSYVENMIKLYIDPDSDGCDYIEMHVMRRLRNIGNTRGMIEDMQTLLASEQCLEQESIISEELPDEKNS